LTSTANTLEPHLAKRILSLPAIALTAALLVVVPASQSSAQEEEDSASEELSQAIEDYLDAQDELAALQEEQQSLEQELEDSEAEVAQLHEDLGEYAYIAYTTSDMQSTAALMSTGNPSDAIDAMTTLSYLGESRADRLNELITRFGRGLRHRPRRRGLPRRRSGPAQRRRDAAR
jgi:type II secretory pathway pseudopilin PulG